MGNVIAGTGESEEVRSKPRVTTPSGRNTVPYISLEDPDAKFKRKKKEYKGGFKQLNRGTIRITSYREGKG